jgi:hypothetical protein
VGDTSGTPLPFEDPSRYWARRVRDRLTRQMLVGYLAALAIGADDDASYGPAVLVTQRVGWAWKLSRDPDYQAKQNHLLHLYGLMDGTCDLEPGDPEVVLCLDEFGPLNLQPHPGRQWVRRSGGDPPRRPSGDPPSSGRTGCAACSPARA